MMPATVARRVRCALRAIGVVAAMATASGAAAAQAGSGGRNALRHQDAPIVVLLSVDGLAPAFLERGITPHFDRLAARGASADGLIPVFPTKTYPNHYSIATGLYAGRHGIVSNGFWEPAWDATYRLGDRASVEDGRWYGGEPIWVTAETQGMVAAAMFFVGTEAAIRGVSPTYWHLYDHGYPNQQRVRNIMDWLRMPAAHRPHLITGYFSIVDDSTHRHGMDAPQTAAAIAEADRLLGMLLDGIETLPHGADVNLIVVSDHGMVPTGRGETVLDDWADLTGARVMASGTIAHIWDSDATRIAAALDRAPHVRAVVRERAPVEWRIANNRRFGDVIVVADEGTLLRRRDEELVSDRATHGYAPSPAMNGVFLAAGSRIRSGVRVPPFENIHISPLMTAILGLQPARGIDGRLDILRPILWPVP